MSRPAFRIAQIPVFLPGSAGIGLGLISYFALPVAQNLVGDSMAAVFIALAHGVMVYFAIFVHELGHALVARKLKYHVHEITLNILGGHTLFTRGFSNPGHMAGIALAGPFWNFLVGAIALGIQSVVSQPIIESMAVWLAWSTFFMAVLNLLPGIPLDGGAVLQAIVWKIRRNEIAGRKVAAIGGMVIAVLWGLSPWIQNAIWGFEVSTLDIILSVTLGSWLGSSAYSAYKFADISNSSDTTVEEMPQEIDLFNFARKTISVAASNSCEDAINQAFDMKAGAIVITDGVKLIGIVRNAALTAVPVEKRATTPISNCARRISDEDFIMQFTDTEQVSRLLDIQYAFEWIITDHEGSVIGVVTRSDLEKISHG